MHVLGYDYFADAPTGRFGLSRVAALIDKARRETRNCLLFDNGDSLQGNPMGDHLAEQDRSGQRTRHPVIAAMNALGYDAGTIGNHDFSYGLPFLRRVLEGAGFPLVASNLKLRRPAMPVAPHLLLRRRMLDRAGRAHDLAIGVLGFLPPQTIDWEPALRGEAQIIDIITAAQDGIARLQDLGADLIVALSHSGIGDLDARPMMENAATALAALPGIDAVIAGHTHRLFPSPTHPAGPGVDPAAGTLAGKPAVMAGFWGSHLGLIDLVLEPVADADAQRPRWRIAQAQSSTRAAQGHEETATVTQPALSAHRATLRHYRRRIGWTDQPLASHFTLIGHDPGMRLVAMAQRWHMRQMLAGSRWTDLPILSAVAPFRAGGRGGPEHYTDIPAGRLTLRSLADLYIFPNRICALLIDGAGVRDWLERSASLFYQIVPGAQDQPLVDPDYPGYHFDLLDGIDWKLDLSQPPRHAPDGRLIAADARRVTALTHRGQPVLDSDRFVLVTNNYRLSDSGPFAQVVAGRPVLVDGPLRCRDVLHRYVARRRRLAPKPGNGWDFLPMPGTSVLFQTGPAARAHLALLDRPAEALGIGDNGFLNLRLHL